MPLKVIIPVNGTPDQKGVRELLLQRYRLDFTHLLELALEYWDLRDVYDDEALYSALETALHRRVARRRRQMEYAELQEATQHLVTAVATFHRHLERILNPVIDCQLRWYPYDMRLVSWLDRAAVLEIRPIPQ